METLTSELHPAYGIVEMIREALALVDARSIHTKRTGDVVRQTYAWQLDSPIDIVWKGKIGEEFVCWTFNEHTGRNPWSLFGLLMARIKQQFSSACGRSVRTAEERTRNVGAYLDCIARFVKGLTVEVEYEAVEVGDPDDTSKIIGYARRTVYSLRKKRKVKPEIRVTVSESGNILLVKTSSKGPAQFSLDAIREWIMTNHGEHMLSQVEEAYLKRMRGEED